MHVHIILSDYILNYVLTLRKIKKNENFIKLAKTHFLVRILKNFDRNATKIPMQSAFLTEKLRLEKVAVCHFE